MENDKRQIYAYMISGLLGLIMIAVIISVVFGGEINLFSSDEDISDDSYVENYTNLTEEDEEDYINESHQDGESIVIGNYYTLYGLYEADTIYEIVDEIEEYLNSKYTPAPGEYIILKETHTALSSYSRIFDIYIEDYDATITVETVTRTSGSLEDIDFK